MLWMVVVRAASLPTVECSRAGTSRCARPGPGLAGCAMRVAAGGLDFRHPPWFPAPVPPGEIDMASPTQLADFLKRAYARFPAGPDRRHMLVLWDHGNGWKVGA